ncbi:MaoC family dehydratase [Sphingomonas sp. ID0503]|uniref:MaoC family dehydratase n=1 Tax=Sphingomonas sp. ID0503 TaxID=3399691 RepID=UPI003AFB65B5
MRYLEDLAVGEVMLFGPLTVDRDEVIAFARQYDFQPFHLSEEAAAQTHFGRLAASGWHTCAMTMRMQLQARDTEESAALGSPGVDNLRWLKPVYPGDTLSGENRITEIRPSRSKPEIGSIRSHVTTRNQHGEDVMTYEAILLMRRRPA